MTVVLEAGKTKELNASLTPVAVAELSLRIELEPATESPSPGVIYAGGMMGIHGIVYNGTDKYAEYNIEWYANDELIWSYPWNPRRIIPGNTHNNYFRWTVPGVGHYDVKVRIYNGFGVIEATDSFDAIEAPAGVAHIYASGLITSSWRVKDTVYIWGSAWIFNDGDGAGEYVEEWYIDDVLVGTNEGYLASGAYDNNEKVWYNSELRLTPGEHGMHVVLKWNGHEDRYPSSGYRTFDVPA